MAVTRLKRKARKNKTVGRLKQQHIKLNKKVILMKSPNKVNQDEAALPVNEASAPADTKKKTTAADNGSNGADTAESKKRAPKPNAETQVDSGAVEAGNGKTDSVDEVGGKSENTPVE